MYTPSLTKRPLLEFKKRPISKALFANQSKFEIKPDSSWNDKQLTIAIVAYNERESLVNLLDKLTSARDRKAGVLLVDNGIDEDIKEVVRKYPIHYIEAVTNLGCTGGRNLAASFVTTPLIAFLDADAAINDDYIEQCIEAISNPQTVCARGRVIPLSEDSRVPPSYDLGNESFSYYPSAEGISVWRTDDFKKAGGFEADLYGGEGIVLCYRMINMYGYNKDQFVYYPKLILHHDYNNDISHLKSKEIRNLTNFWSIDRRYPLLKSLVHDYNESSKNSRNNKAHLDSSHAVQSIIEQSRKDFNEQLEKIHVNTLETRWNSSKSIENNGYKFSVIIPCYNLGSLAIDAVKSIMRQTMDGIQIIIVDDVSTDQETKNTLKTLENHVRVIRRRDNGGASAARNTGIAAADADYILCLDADDSIEPTYIEEAYNLFLMDKSVGVVAPNANITGERRGKWIVHGDISLPKALLSSPIPNASCYRKGVWEQVGGYDENMRGYEDWEFWIRVLKSGWTIRNIPRQHYIYFTRPDSKVKTSNKNALDIISYIYDKHADAFTQHSEFVITRLYTRYVEQRNIIHTLQKDISDRKENFLLKNSRRVIIKSKAATSLLIKGDTASFSKKLKNNLKKIRNKVVSGPEK